MKIIVSPVDYNHDETAIIFYCRAKDREDYIRVYGIFDTEHFGSRNKNSTRKYRYKK